jgi:hypothetical protein
MDVLRGLWPTAAYAEIEDARPADECAYNLVDGDGVRHRTHMSWDGVNS